MRTSEFDTSRSRIIIKSICWLMKGFFVVRWYRGWRFEERGKAASAGTEADGKGGYCQGVGFVVLDSTLTESYPVHIEQSIHM